MAAHDHAQINLLTHQLRVHQDCLTALHLAPDALRAVGLPEFASCAEKALAIHSPPPYPTTVHGWDEFIEQIRDAQLEDDFDESAYDAIEKEFFALYHADSTHFRTKLHEYVLAHLDE